MSLGPEHFYAFDGPMAPDGKKITHSFCSQLGIVTLNGLSHYPQWMVGHYSLDSYSLSQLRMVIQLRMVYLNEIVFRLLMEQLIVAE